MPAVPLAAKDTIDLARTSTVWPILGFMLLSVLFVVLGYLSLRGWPPNWMGRPGNPPRRSPLQARIERFSSRSMAIVFMAVGFFLFVSDLYYLGTFIARQF